jgi:hypothetical protein
MTATNAGNVVVQIMLSSACLGRLVNVCMPTITMTEDEKHAVVARISSTQYNVSHDPDRSMNYPRSCWPRLLLI